MTVGAGGGPPSLAGRWRALPPGWRWLLGLVGAVVALNVALAGLERVTGGPAPAGPASSSYAPGRDGLAASAELLADHGHPVHRLRARLHRADLDTAATVVVADAPSLSDEESQALGRFVQGGGRLVASGPGAGPALGRMLGPGLAWVPDGVVAAGPLAPVAEVEGVTRVRAAGPGSWRDAGPMLPVLAGPDGPILATVASWGRGRIVAVADSSVWQNRLLGQADNALFALAAAGPPGRPVRFAEAHHGYGAGDGLAAVPSHWKWSAAVAVTAVLAWMWSRGRRLGPPERPERELPPPRRAYVDAMAASLVRTRQPAAAVRPLQVAARRSLARRAGLAADADEAAYRRAARRLGLRDDEVGAVLAPAEGDDDVLAAARALSRLQGG